MNNLLMQEILGDTECTDSLEAEERQREQWEAVVSKEKEWDPRSEEERIRETALARIERDYIGQAADEAKVDPLVYRLDVIEEEESHEISNSDKTDQLREESQEDVEKRQLYELVEGESAVDDEDNIDESHLKKLIQEIDK